MFKKKQTISFKKKLIFYASIVTLSIVGGIKLNLVQADSTDTEVAPSFTNKSNQQLPKPFEENINENSLLRRNPQSRSSIGQPVTIYYKNEQGEEVYPRQVLNGNVGSNYSALVPQFGYLRVKKIIGNPAGVFSDVPQEVTYIYTDEGEPVTIIYEDENGNPIYTENGETIPVHYITGKIGVIWTSRQWHKKGYIFKRTKIEGAVFQDGTDYYGKLSSKSVKITYVYSDKSAPITVHYLREDNSKIIADEWVTGRPDYEYDIKPRSFSGYTLKETKGNLKDTFSDEPKDVTFIYKATLEEPVTPTKIGNLLVHYQDENGNQIATSEVLTGKVGDGYVSSTKEISGYTLKVRPDNATGFFTEAQQVVTYIYAASGEEKPVVPNNPEQQGTNSQKPIVTPTNNKRPSRNNTARPISKDPAVNKKHLPQTGADEQTNYLMLALGLTISLLSSFGGYIFTWRKRKN